MGVSTTFARLPCEAERLTCRSQVLPCGEHRRWIDQGRSRSTPLQRRRYRLATRLLDLHLPRPRITPSDPRFPRLRRHHHLLLVLPDAPATPAGREGVRQVLARREQVQRRRRGRVRQPVGGRWRRRTARQGPRPAPRVRRRRRPLSRRLHLPSRTLVVLLRCLSSLRHTLSSFTIPDV